MRAIGRRDRQRILGGLTGPEHDLDREERATHVALSMIGLPSGKRKTDLVENDIAVIEIASFNNEAARDRFLRLQGDQRGFSRPHDAAIGFDPRRQSRRRRSITTNALARALLGGRRTAA